jgi:GH15 family glucan-1,4-alpha-glucosidase
VEAMMAYQPIENYGVIGDMHSLALVGMDGSIDWLCFPHFDSPSIFGALLDDNKGGRFKISPVSEEVKYKQFYWPDTNVLVTRFFACDGVGELTDYMPVDEGSEDQVPHTVVRRVTAVRGDITFRLECRPAFNYARDEHTAELSPQGVCFYGPKMSVGLATEVPLKQDGAGVTAEFTLREGQCASFVLRSFGDGGSCGLALSEAEEMELFKKTVNYWRRWLSKCTYAGRWRETVHRSALALKLLTFDPTGAIVAAPTASLPEAMGGERNWDYRFTWLRDAAFTIYALLRIGFTDEAAKFMHFLEERCKELNPDGSLQVMYGIEGQHELGEEMLDHLDGYKGSKPVRVGNGAFKQLQLDIYGELMDSVYLYNKYASPISYDMWKQLRKLVNWVCQNWHKEDEGVWEVRGGRRYFTYSKLMCWVAMDRGIRLAQKRSFPAELNDWIKVRDKIYEDIMERGWNDEVQAFVRHYGSGSLDASVLMMPLTFFLSPTDPRMLKTIDAINRTPEKGGLVSNSLVHRYNVKTGADGIPGDEGTFNICSFWLVEALTRAGRTEHARLDEARLMFEKMLGYANHLGLYAEETGLAGEALGNFPQAFTHLSLISAAVNLDKALGGRG